MREVEFHNGNTMPQIGLGVFRVEDGEDCKNAVKHAIVNGYRSIDTAMIYKNEKSVGEGIKAGIKEAGIDRSDLFVTSKLWLDDYGPGNVEKAYDTSLENLQLDYLDLYLMHWPGTDEDLMIETWHEMERLYNNNRVKNIGVSNFMVSHMETLLQRTDVKPVINQVEYHPYLVQNDLKLYLDSRKIVMESWSPLVNAKILDDETIKEIAEETGKSPAQVVIRWNIENGLVTIPKSVTPERIEENIDVFGFSLSKTQISRINQLNKDERNGPDPATFTGNR
ncbi:aldo/keto reductase [Salinicoccus siamensis]|uniref:Aldo/keto reductase n=1 Tax=Salinicoccus siamensis TaxID=381830 RepID=A0ABV5Z581_9STAP